MSSVTFRVNIPESTTEEATVSVRFQGWPIGAYLQAGQSMDNAVAQMADQINHVLQMAVRELRKSLDKSNPMVVR